MAVGAFPVQAGGQQEEAGEADEAVGAEALGRGLLGGEVGLVLRPVVGGAEVPAGRDAFDELLVHLGGVEVLGHGAAEVVKAVRDQQKPGDRGRHADPAGVGVRPAAGVWPVAGQCTVGGRGRARAPRPVRSPQWTSATSAGERSGTNTRRPHVDEREPRPICSPARRWPRC